jgi:class 3 adenylate cyclase
VLFADVVGFTSLAERLDPEELRSLMMGCFQTLAEEVRHYDGFIEKFIGDAILAVFGAPVAHEDDPESGQSGRRWACRPGYSSYGPAWAAPPPERSPCESASIPVWW